MSKKWKVWVEPAGMNIVRNSKELQAVLQKIGNDVVAKAGEGYEATVRTGGSRAKCTVRAVTPRAYYSNLKHNTLLKALGG